MLTSTTKGTGQINWLWFFENNISSKGESTTHYYRENGKYPIAMITENRWGCRDTMVKYIVIESDFAVYVPNVFSPNEDGLNDIFLPLVRGVKNYRIEIFNRWGESVFLSFNPGNGWDGSYKGDMCNADIFSYILKVTSNLGEEIERTGSILLNR